MLASIYHILSPLITVTLVLTEHDSLVGNNLNLKATFSNDERQYIKNAENKAIQRPLQLQKEEDYEHP